MTKELTPATDGEVSAGAVECQHRTVWKLDTGIWECRDCVRRFVLAELGNDAQVCTLADRLATAEAEVERLDAELNSPLGQFQEARRLAVHWEEVAKGLEGEVERLREAGQFALFVFLGCDRIGAEKDEPEGVRFIQISDTLAKDAEGRLRHALAERREDGDGD